MIAAGYVHRKNVAYCSEPCFTAWQAQKRANRDFLNAMELEDKDTGERLSLIDNVMGSVANPSNRRRELIARMHGFECIADAQGLTGAFYTLTVPSRFHAMRRDGRRNDKYDGASPRDTQQYLCRVWAKTRAAWLRAGIRAFGFRVAEPHHDGTPHWHLLLFMPPHQLAQATAIFQRYALAEEGDEPGARDSRFTIKPIDRQRGSATGYIAKYISKNIDGYALGGEQDSETDTPVTETAGRVSAWASRWAIRQFQQIGGAPVMVWRELRRLGDRELVLHPEIEPAREAANASDWAGYVLAQGGPLVSRELLRVRLSYEVTENGNVWGDDVVAIAGIYCPLAGEASRVFTRTARYQIVPRRSGAPEAAFSSGIAAPWSSVTNCTLFPKRPAVIAEADVVPPDGDYSGLSRPQRRAVANRLIAAAWQAEQEKYCRRMARSLSPIADAGLWRRTISDGNCLIDSAK